jgi:hypothetical protein
LFKLLSTHLSPLDNTEKESEKESKKEDSIDKEVDLQPYTVPVLTSSIKD